MGELLLTAMVRRPRRVAVRVPAVGDTSEELTYDELFHAATDGARRLTQISGLGGSVAILGPNSINWVSSLFAVALAGRQLVPINPSLSPDEVAAILRDCGAEVLLAVRDYRGRDLYEEASSLVGDVPTLGTLLDLETWIGDLAGQELPGLAVEVDPDSTFLVQYTSGTTGRPKGAMLSHRACITSASTMTQAFNPVEHEVWASPMPLHHVGASVAHAIALATIQGTYVMLTAFDPAHLVRAARDNSATLVAGVPTVYLGILEDPELQTEKVPSLRVAMLGGATIPPVLVERVETHFDACVAVLYGQSESPAITQTNLDDSPVTKAETVGRPLPGREVAIVDPETGKTLAPGEVGELRVRSTTNMHGYLGLPDESAEVLSADGWLRTGDLCSQGADGLVRFHGRIRDVILRGGENIYARQVEDAIMQLSEVAQVAVIGIPDPKWGEIVAAFVQPLPGAVVDTDDLAGQLSKNMARFKVPTRWRVVDQMPLTASGKIQKHLLEIPEEWR